MPLSILSRLIFDAMKKTFVKIAALLLCAANLIVLSGCKGTVGGYTYDSAADFREDEGEIFADVPKGEYGGYVFRILNGRNGLPSTAVDAETLTGSVLSDKIFNRNYNVETRLNITIEEIRDTAENVFETACRSVMADEDVYSAVWNSASYMGAMAANGYLVTSDYLVEMDMEKPWWNKEATEALSVDQKSFLIFGDLQLSYYDAHAMVGVNMEMIEKIDGMPNPYELVDNGTWTVSKMLEMAQAATSDIDGNQAMTYEDRYGAAIDRDAILPFIFGCDTNMSAKDSYDLPVITCIDNEKFFDVYTLITQSMYNRSTSMYVCEDNEADNMTDLDMFKNERSLFVVTTVGELNELRYMDCEFGVLPMPKYWADQKEYVSYISGEDIWALGIPASSRNFLRTGVILENLGAETWREGGVRDTYVDSTLEFKYVNDEKSRENLHTILSSGRFDLLEVYGWGELSETVVEEAASASEKLMSTLAQNERSVRADLADFIEKISEFE